MREELRKESWARIMELWNRWSWEGTGKLGKKHGEVTRGKK